MYETHPPEGFLRNSSLILETFFLFNICLFAEKILGYQIYVGLGLYAFRNFLSVKLNLKKGCI